MAMTVVSAILFSWAASVEVLEGAVDWPSVKRMTKLVTFARSPLDGRKLFWRTNAKALSVYVIPE